MHRLINLGRRSGITDKNKYAILILWAFVNSFFLFKNGIVTTGEAEKYIGQANIFLNKGNVDTLNLWFYFVEIGLLAFCMKLNLSFAIVVGIQLFFNLLAVLYFYRTLAVLFSSSSIAFIGTLLLLFNQPYQEFNSFLQTESLFYSFTLMLSCFTIQIKKVYARNIVFIILLLAVISMTRPTGLLFIVPVFFYLFFVFARKMSNTKKASMLILFGAIFLLIINAAMKSGGEFDFILPFKDADIICGAPSSIQTAAVQNASSNNSLLGLLHYIANNFGEFTRLAWLKTIAFFGLYRSYYSKWHNIYLIAFFYSLHIMAISASGYWIKKNRYQFIYLLSIILATWLTVMLTCDDWHNRFYLSISPYIIMLSMGFLKMLLKKDSATSGFQPNYNR